MVGSRFFKTALAAAAAAALTVVAAPATAAPVLYAANGHYYDFVAGNISWDDALAAAETFSLPGYDSYLVTITSAGEDAFVKALVGANEYVWAAGTDRDAEGVWKWAAGPELGQIFYGAGAPLGAYSNWNVGEPNNSNTENYLHVNANAPKNWNDIYATFGAAGYVVEYSGAVPEPATWALMIGGFGLMGASLRRRRTAGAATA